MLAHFLTDQSTPRALSPPKPVTALTLHDLLSADAPGDAAVEDVASSFSHFVGVSS